MPLSEIEQRDSREERDGRVERVEAAVEAGDDRHNDKYHQHGVSSVVEQLAKGRAGLGTPGLLAVHAVESLGDEDGDTAGNKKP